MTQLLSQGLEWPSAPLSSAVGATEQEADLTQLVARAALHGDIISPNQHCRYNANTYRCVTAADIKVVLLTRNLADSLVSLRDHIRRGVFTWPMTHINEVQWRGLGESKQLDFIVDLAAPWYFNFYAGWFNSPLIETERVFRVAYEDLLADTPGKLAELYAYLSVNSPARSPRRAVAAAETVDTRKNLARVGRGALLLSDAQQKRLRDFSQYYPDTDFSSIGLETQPDHAARRYALSVSSAQRLQVKPAA